jgi:ParB family chromosome partitioning protein
MDVVSISPFRCRLWAEHERLEEYINEETCKSEIESIAAYGQRIPVLGRPIKNDRMHDIEIIYGARRLFVARHLNIPLLVEVREMNDQEAAIALDTENRQRKDVSPYERGLSYLRWLRSKYFGSQEEIARVLGISASQVSRSLKLARLPPVVLNAFPSPLHIAESYGLDLHRAMQDDRRRKLLFEVARRLAKEAPHIPADKVFERLINESVFGGGRRVQSHDEVIKNSAGKVLFRVRHFRKSVAFVLDSQRLSKQSLSQFKLVMADALERTVGQTVAADQEGPRSAVPRVIDQSGLEGRRLGAAEIGSLEAGAATH